MTKYIVPIKIEFAGTITVEADCMDNAEQQANDSIQARLCDISITNERVRDWYIDSKSSSEPSHKYYPYETD